MARPVASTRQLPVCAFVLLRLDSDDLRRLPLSDRKAKLRERSFAQLALTGLLQRAESAA